MFLCYFHWHHVWWNVNGCIIKNWRLFRCWSVRCWDEDGYSKHIIRLKCWFRSNDIRSYLYCFDYLSSFYKSINFDETIVTAEHQVGQAINFGITFNDAVAINGLQFAPTSCEVINVNNEDEVYDLWNSSDDMMCNPEDHPVDFEVYQTPDSANQFFGFQYTGNISIIILVFFY